MMYNNRWNRVLIFFSNEYSANLVVHFGFRKLYNVRGSGVEITSCMRITIFSLPWYLLNNMLFDIEVVGFRMVFEVVQYNFVKYCYRLLVAIA